MPVFKNLREIYMKIRISSIFWSLETLPWWGHVCPPIIVCGKSTHVVKRLLSLAHRHPDPAHSVQLSHLAGAFRRLGVDSWPVCLWLISVATSYIAGDASDIISNLKSSLPFRQSASTFSSGIINYPGSTFFALDLIKSLLKDVIIWWVNLKDIFFFSFLPSGIFSSHTYPPCQPIQHAWNTSGVSRSWKSFQKTLKVCHIVRG